MASLLVTAVLAFAEVDDGNCTVIADAAGVERFGGDYDAIPLTENEFAACAELCCLDARCLAFSFNNISCGAKGQPCCQLKEIANPPTPNTYGPSVQTGVVLKNAASSAAWPTPNYPPSTAISSCTLDWASTQRPGVSGDTWPSTWAANGSTYVMGCDNNKAYMNWWHVDAEEQRLQTGNEGQKGALGSTLGLSLINNFPVSNAEVLQVLLPFFGYLVDY
jgi:hypothetical protein